MLKKRLNNLFQTPYSFLYKFLHWGIALPVILNLWITEGGDLIHQIVGYTCAAFVLSRIFLLISNPSVFFQERSKMQVFVYLLMFLMVFGLGISGYLLEETDTFFGDETIEDLHEILSNGIMILFGLHLAGITLDSIRTKRRTWLKMIRS